MEGSNSRHDRGYVYYNGRPLCDDAVGGSGWDINDAHVICKMLGFSRATNAYNDACPYGGCPPADIPFVKGGFKCTGSENHILDCPHDDPVSNACGSNGITNGSGSNSDDLVGVECE